MPRSKTVRIIVAEKPKGIRIPYLFRTKHWVVHWRVRAGDHKLENDELKVTHIRSGRIACSTDSRDIARSMARLLETEVGDLKCPFTPGDAMEHRFNPDTIAAESIVRSNGHVVWQTRPGDGDEVIHYG